MQEEVSRSSKICREERKTSKRGASVTVSMNVRAAMLVATRGSRRRRSTLGRHAHSYARVLTCFAFFSTVFEEKRDCSLSKAQAQAKVQAHAQPQAYGFVRTHAPGTAMHRQRQRH